jgi:general secretion pathway protein M
MKRWLQVNRKAAVLVGLTLALPLCLLLYISTDLLMLRKDYQEQIDRLEPRIARLKGLAKSEKKLQVVSKKVEASLGQLAYGVEEDSDSVATSLQKNVRTIISASGLSVANSQVLPVKQGDGFDQIRLKLTVKGDVPALDAALMQLTNYTPLLLVESVEIWPDRQPRRPQGAAPAVRQLTASLQLMSVRPLL